MPYFPRLEYLKLSTEKKALPLPIKKCKKMYIVYIYKNLDDNSSIYSEESRPDSIS